MNDKQVNELKFWTELINKEHEDGFIRRRRGDFYRHMSNFDGWADLSGNGLEIGTGCFSQLAFSNANYILSIDPLCEEFIWIFPKANDYKNITLQQMDGEKLDTDEKFDWVVCWNVIDHTPNPEKLLNEVKRVLKPGGKFIFEVNFDDKLNLWCHYKLWNEDVVNFYLKDFKCLFSKVVDNRSDQQRLFYAVYEN